MSTDSQHFETLALHGGTYRSDPATGAVAVPIYQTTSYQFHDTDHASRLFALEELDIYTRVTNPTQDAFEQRIAAIEGGAAALAVASGQAASAFALLTVAQAGDNVVSSTDLYGGTWALFAHTLKQFGIETRFVDPADPENFRRATDDKTKAYYAETLPNPKLQVFPIREVANIGRELGVPLIVDNTAAPLIARPIEHGAAVVVYSATKYIGGHGTSIGGVIVDAGNFPWEEHAGRFPLLTEPDPAYNGAIWTEAAKPLGPIAFVLRARVKLLRDIGAGLSPFNAFQLLQGLETLPLRLRQHNENAVKVADFLLRHPDVDHVIFPGLQHGESRRRADAVLKGGYGALVGFELKGGREAGRAFIDSLQLLYHVANIGDARSLAIHPASTTHSQLTPEDQLLTGVTPGYVRLSVGLEHPDDIIADIAQALDKVGAVEPTSVGSQGRLNTCNPAFSGDLNDQILSSPLSRRGLLKLAGGGVAAATAATAAPALFAPAIAGPAPKVRLAWTEVAACHSPMAFGVSKGFYAKEGVEVELFYQGASGQTLIQALATNKADVGAGLVLDWLKPLEQGFNVKLFVGSHGGCQRLLAAKSSGIADIAGLKGKRIATWEAGAPPKVAFSVALAKAGLDPEHDVDWVYAPFDLVGETVKRGDADVAAHMDPWAYNLQKTYDLVKIADTQTGVYKDRVCCVLGANGPFLEANRDAVRRIAAANLAIHEYTAAHPDEVAQWYADNLKPGMTAEALADDLGSLVFHNHPVGKELVKQIQASYEDLKLTKVIDPETDPAEIAQRVTVDILAA